MARKGKSQLGGAINRSLFRKARPLPNKVARKGQKPR